MIDVANVRYRLVAHLPNGAALPIDCSGLQWEEQTGELAVRVQATCPNRQTALGGYLHEVLALATRLFLYADWGSGFQEIWRGVIFSWRFTDNGNQTVEITAYDNLIYLQLSEDDRVYQEGLPAPVVLFDILRDWDIDTAGITQLANVTLPKLVFRGARISQMLLQILDHVFWRGGGTWILRSRADMLEIVRPGSNTPIYVLSSANVEEFSDEQDMSDLITEVQVLGQLADDGAGEVRPPIVSRAVGRTEFGRLVAIVRDEGSDSPAQANETAERLLRTRGEPSRVQRLTAPDLPFLRRGDFVHVSAGTLNDRYAITGIQHDADRKRMQLTIDTSGSLDVFHWTVLNGQSGGQPFPAQRSGPQVR